MIKILSFFYDKAFRCPIARVLPTDQHEPRLNSLSFFNFKYIFLSFFTENDFSNKDIALMLGVSKRTVENRMQEYKMTNISRYHNIDDDLLDAHVQRILTNFPRSGLIMTFVQYPISPFL